MSQHDVLLCYEDDEHAPRPKGRRPEEPLRPKPRNRQLNASGSRGHIVRQRLHVRIVEFVSDFRH